MKPYLRKSLLALFALSALLVPAASASATGGALAPGGPSEWISNFGTRGTGVEIRPMIRDVNLDSKADAVLVYNGDWYVALSNGTTFGTYSLWLDGPSPTTSGVKYMLANTTGDSRLDAVSVEKGDWKSWAGQPGSFSSTAVVRSGFGVPVAGKTTNWLTGDVTGDGKADLVTVDNNKWSVVPATSSILDPPVTMYTYPTAISDSTVKSAMLSDRTNDNRADAWTVNPITGMWNVQDSLGNTLSPTSLSYDTGLPAGDNVFKALIDVNADNRLDAVTQVNGMWGIALRNATGFDTPKPWDKGFAQPPTGSDVPMIGDLNFDGSADPVGFSNGTWYAATALSVGAQIKAGAAGWTPSVLFDEFDGTLPAIGSAGSKWSSQRTDPHNYGYASDHPYSNVEGASYGPGQNVVSQGFLTQTLNKLPSPVNGLSYTTGSINSFGRFSFQGGYVEARIAVPRCEGCFPAFWMMPLTRERPPEVDIFEYFPNVDGGVYPFSNIHWNNAAGVEQQDSVGWKLGDTTGSFHTFGMLWTTDYIQFFVDGFAGKRSPKAEVPTQAMYLILTLQEAQYVPDPQTGLPTSTRYNAPDGVRMFTDYIKVWK